MYDSWHHRLETGMNAEMEAKETHSYATRHYNPFGHHYGTYQHHGQHFLNQEVYCKDLGTTLLRRHISTHETQSLECYDFPQFQDFLKKMEGYVEKFDEQIQIEFILLHIEFMAEAPLYYEKLMKEHPNVVYDLFEILKKTDLVAMDNRRYIKAKKILDKLDEIRKRDEEFPLDYSWDTQSLEPLDLSNDFLAPKTEMESFVNDIIRHLIINDVEDREEVVGEFLLYVKSVWNTLLGMDILVWCEIEKAMILQFKTSRNAKLQQLYEKLFEKPLMISKLKTFRTPDDLVAFMEIFPKGNPRAAVSKGTSVPQSSE